MLNTHGGEEASVASPPRSREANRGEEADGVCLSRTESGWDKKWVKSSWKQSEGTAGEFTWTAGKWYGDAEADKGIQTGPDARFFAIGAPFPKISTEGKELVLQVRWFATTTDREAGRLPPSSFVAFDLTPRPRRLLCSSLQSTSRSWTAAAATSSCSRLPRAFASR